jgi:hypothetical protein
VKKFFPVPTIFSEDHGNSAVQHGPQLTTITITENEPILLTVKNWIEDEHQMFGIEIYKDSTDDIPSLPALGAANDIPKHSKSDESFAFIRKCIKDCSENHGACNGNVPDMPRRVLDLSPSSDRAKSSFDSVKLVEPNGQIKERYAALSYCWGTGISTILTTENIEEKMNGINITTMPTALQDAIIVARRLNISYIWIDALCIIQNDRDDWAAEAAKMGSIYRDAFVTIAAVCSPSSDNAFLRPRNPEFDSKAFRFPDPLYKRSVSNILAFGNKSPRVAARRTSRVADSNRTGVLMANGNSIASGPLSLRCWALQERALSTRMIHFTDEGIAWECMMASHSEDGRVCTASYLRLWNELASLEGFEQERRLRIYWRKILMDYTKRSVTKRSDLLSALSGMASHMNNIHPSLYLAGLWQDRLIEDLCWTVASASGPKDQRNSLPVHEEDRTLPSWSWISVAEAVSFSILDERGYFSPTSSIRGYGCTLATSDPFGQVKDGYIEIEGGVMECSLLVAADPKSGRVFTILGWPGPRYTCGGLIDNDVLLISIDYPVNSLPQRHGKTFRRGYLGEEMKPSEGIVWCLELGQRHNAEFTIGESSGLRLGMMLVPSSRVPGSFERIGMTDLQLIYKEVWINTQIRRIRIV